MKSECALVLYGAVLVTIWSIQRSDARGRRSDIIPTWKNQPQEPQGNQYFFPRTDNYYHNIKPEAIVEIVLDSEEAEDEVEEELPLESESSSVVEHAAYTTNIKSQAEYKASCVKEPGCRWECEPRQDEFPPDCDCVCSYFQAYWDNIP